MSGVRPAPCRPRSGAFDISCPDDIFENPLPEANGRHLPYRLLDQVGEAPRCIAENLGFGYSLHIIIVFPQKCSGQNVQLLALSGPA